MSTNHHTPYVDKVGDTPGTTFVAAQMNAPLATLDQAITDNATAIAGKAATAHTHDDRYFTETEMSASGGGGAVHWDNVTNKPSIGSGDGDTVAPAAHSADYVPQWSSTPDSKTLVEGFPITAAGKAILDDATPAAQRATLGVDTVGIDISYQSTDKPGASAEVSCWPKVACTFPANLTTSTYYAPTGPTADAVVSIRKNGVEFGTATISSATNTVTFASTEASFNGTTDRLSILFPTPQDATWAGVSFGFKGVRS